MSNKFIAIFVLMIFVVSLSGCGCRTYSPLYKLKLEIWGTIDSPDNFSDIFERYTSAGGVVEEIVYKKFAADTYKKELIEALAAGKGPDIFMINGTWTPSFLDKIVPAPAELISEKNFRDTFVDATANEFINDGSIYAVPLSVDSLALYYNKDLLNEAGIALPPRTWDEFAEVAKRLTKIDNYGNIVQSGAAMGTAYNIHRSTDILGLLMLQNKTEMTSDDGSKITINGAITEGGLTIYPAEKALNFYTQFAKIGSSYYTWNPAMDYSIDSFAKGSLAMMFNYQWQRATILAKSPKLNFAVAPVPQYPNTTKIDFANFWGYAVALNKKPTVVGDEAVATGVTDEIRIAETWKFLKFLTMQPELAPANQTGVRAIDPNFDPAKNYLEKTQKPAARKDIIATQKNDSILGVFAEQNLFAKNWKQINPEVTESVMAEVIDQINLGKSEPREGLNSITSRINQISEE